MIHYSLPNSGRITLGVFDVAGREVALVTDEVVAEGRHEAIWDGHDLRGVPVSSGTYFLRIESNEKIVTRRVILVR